MELQVTDLQGSALRKTQRVIKAQGYDARSFTGGRILRLLFGRATSTGNTYKQLFIANLTGLSLDDAIADADIPDAVVISHDAFTVSDQLGPAVISETHLEAVGCTARELIDRVVSPALLMVPRAKAAERYPGPFSIVQQQIAAGLREREGLGLYGARAMWPESAFVVKEECYSLLAPDGDAAASIVERFALERRTEVSHTPTIEIEDTCFDRPHYGNPLLIIEHRSTLGPRDFLKAQGLSAIGD